MYYKYVSLLLGVMAISLFSGCKSSKPAEPLKVAVVIGSELSGQANIINRAAQSAARDEGEGKIIISTVKNPTEAAYKKNIDKLIKAYEDKTSLIGFVIAGRQDVPMKEIIRTSVVTGHPLVLFGYDYPDNKSDAYVGVKQRLAGDLLAEQVAKSGSTPGKMVVVLTGPEGTAIYEKRLRALKTKLHTNVDLRILKIIRNGAESAGALKKLLTQTPNIYAILSTGPWIFDKQYQDVLKSYKGKIYAIGNTPEALQALKNGKVNALIVEDIFTQVYESVRLCISRLRNQIITSPEPLAPVVVTGKSFPEFEKRWGKKSLSEKLN